MENWLRHGPSFFLHIICKLLIKRQLTRKIVCQIHLRVYRYLTVNKDFLYSGEMKYTKETKIKV